MSAMLWLIIGVVLALVVYAAALWQMMRRRGKRVAWLPLLRLLVLVAGAYLIWKACWDRVAARAADEKEDEAMQLVILEDVSRSMQFGVGGGLQRRDLAAEAIAEVKGAVARAQPPVQVEHVVFADRLLPVAQRAAAEDGATQLSGALAEALSRLDAERILVVSDGATTDGPVPAYIRDWLQNRRLGLFAICTANPDAPAYDWRVEDVAAASINPPHLSVDSRLVGVSERNARLTVSVDGKRIEELTLAASDNSRQTAITLPELEPGWHVYEAAIDPQRGEVTGDNNRRLGVFRQTAPNRILYLYGAFRMENVHIADHLRTLYADRVTVMHLRDPALADLRLNQFEVLIASDVGFAQLPTAIRRTLRQGYLTCLLLAGPHTDDWDARSLRDFPVSLFQESWNLAERVQHEGVVTVHRSNRDPSFYGLNLDRLSLNLLHHGRFPTSARTVFSVTSGSQQFPFVLADRWTNPRYLVVLADTTWKWALSPDPAVRQQQRIFWNTLFTWLLGEAGDARPLTLTFDTVAARPGQTRVRLTTRDPRAHTQLSDVRLQIEHGDGSRTVTPERDRDGFFHDYEHPSDLPQIVWFQGAATVRDERWQSERRPLIVEASELELLQPFPRPEILQAAVSADGQFAYAADTDDVLAALLAPPEQGLPPPLTRQRDRGIELLLASLLVLLLAVEWWIERWLKDHS